MRLDIGNTKARMSAVWLALIAVLTLLMSPALGGRTHAAMLSTGPAAMTMTMTGMAKVDGGPRPCRHDGSAACSIACALASQLLPSWSRDAEPWVGASGRVEYAELLVSLGDAPAEQGTPPPR